MTLAQIRTSLQALGYGTDTAATQNEAINTAYREIIGMRRWPFLEKQNTSNTTVVGTPGYTLAIVDLLWIDAVRIEVGTEYDAIDYLPPQQFRSREHMDRDTGTPIFWTEVNGQIRFWPSPDKVYTITIDYLRYPADLSVDADVPVIPAEYHDAMKWGAAHQMAMRERDWFTANMFKQEWEESKQRLLSAYGPRQRQSARNVIRSPVWATIEQGGGTP